MKYPAKMIVGKIAVARYRALAVVVVAVGAIALFAGSAQAAVNPAAVGCYTGSSCFIELGYQVTYNGSTGGDNGVVVQPPPCIGFLFGNAYSGSEAIISLLGGTVPVAQPTLPPPPASPTASPTDTVGGAAPTATATPAATTPTATTTATTTALITTPSATASPPADLSSQEQQILSQADQLISTHPMPAGNWYRVTGNPNATTADQAQCNNLPPYIWEPGANNVLMVDGLNVPPVTLAGLAYSQLNLAKLGTVTLDPQTKSDTNLPTFVQVPMVAPPTAALSVTAKGDPYVWASAETPNGEAATVWAWVTGLSINAGTANATTYTLPQCSTAHLSADGHTFMLGTRYSAAQMAQVGADEKIDCGVTYTAPGTYDLTASITWNACWSQGLPETDGPPATGCNPVPGAAGLAPSTSAPSQVVVREIQSLNG